MKRSLFIAMTLMLGCSMAVAQTTEKDAPKSGWKTAKQVKERSPAVMSDYEMSWQALTTHGEVELVVGNKDKKIRKMFKDGEAPFFNAFEEGLKPGVYGYKVTFTPNEVGDAQKNKQDLIDKRKKLLKRRMELMRAGKRDEAKAALKEANQVRDEFGKWISENHNRNDLDYITQSGRVIVNKDGQIKKYDPKKSIEDEAKKLIEQKNRENEEKNEKSQIEY